jgi:hypothetical protein
MNRYVPITFSAIFLLMPFLPCHVSAASITETKAAIGKNCVASGSYSTAMGRSTTASGIDSTAMGFGTTASGQASTAIGSSTRAIGDFSIAMGNVTSASGEVSWAGGQYMLLQDAADHTFVWGYSDFPKHISTANAFLIFPAGTAGKVGIGTAAPKYALHVHKNSSSYAYLSFTNTTTGPGSLDGALVGLDPNEDFRIHTYESNNILFYIDNDEKVRIASSGNVGIGTNGPGQKLDIAGGNGRVETGNHWLTDSDSRLKKNITTLEGSLEKISRLRGVRFDSREAVYADKGSGKHIGVIAQELEKEYPELVIGDKETGYKAVAYDKLTAVLIEAVKELKTENQTQKEVLREQLEKQQAEIEELRSMIRELKS